MQEEFELTYLIKELPAGVLQSPSKEILDIYLPSISEHPTLRIRKSGEKYEMTKKQPVSGTDSSHQIENTIPLTAEEFAELESLSGKRVRKIRYYYTENGVTYEIDMFQDSLAGLVVVDVEFSSNEEKAGLTPPAWVLVDVTPEKFIAGGMVCGKSYEDIEEKLAEFGYHKILTS